MFKKNVLLKLFFVNFNFRNPLFSKIMSNFCQHIIYKVHSSYGPLAYFSDIFISGKNVVCRNDNIFARNEDIGKMRKRSITWTGFSKVWIHNSCIMMIRSNRMVLILEWKWSILGIARVYCKSWRNVSVQKCQ